MKLIKAMVYAFLSFSGYYSFIRDILEQSVAVDSWVLFLFGFYFLWRFTREWNLYKEYRHLVAEIR